MRVAVSSALSFENSPLADLRRVEHTVIRLFLMRGYGDLEPVSLQKPRKVVNSRVRILRAHIVVLAVNPTDPREPHHRLVLHYSPLRSRDALA